MDSTKFHKKDPIFASKPVLFASATDAPADLFLGDLKILSPDQKRGSIAFIPRYLLIFQLQSILVI